MMEGANLVAVLPGDCFFGQELVGAIAVNLYVEFAAQHLGQGFQLEVAPGSDGVLVALGHLRIVGIPLGHVVAGIFKRHAHHFEVAHPRGRQLIAAAVDALGILAGCELYRSGSVGEDIVAVRPNLFLITTAWPPIMLAEPCSRSSVVTPAASAR